MTPKQILDSFSETLMQDERILSAQERALVATLLRHARAASEQDSATHAAVNAVIAAAIGETVAQRAFSVLGGSIVQKILEGGIAVDDSHAIVDHSTPRPPFSPSGPQTPSAKETVGHSGPWPPFSPSGPQTPSAKETVGQAGPWPPFSPSGPQTPSAKETVGHSSPRPPFSPGPQTPSADAANLRPVMHGPGTPGQPQAPGTPGQPQGPGVAPPPKMSYGPNPSPSPTQPQGPGITPPPRTYVGDPSNHSRPRSTVSGGLAEEPLRSGTAETSAAVVDRPQVLAAQCVILDEFLSPQEVAELTRFTLANESGFKTSEVISPTVEQGIVNYEHRRSNVLMDVGPYQDLILARIKGVLPSVLEKLGMEDFDISGVEAQITASNDGDYFHFHSDNGSAQVTSRYLTFVYFFHREPRQFEGGELRIHDAQLEKGEYVSEGSFQTIVPQQNQIVFFPCELMHEITPIRCASRRFADSRFTLNGWLRK